MSRGIHKLTALRVQRARKRGRYGDGGSLYLQVTEDGHRSWVLRYKRGGRERWMGLGPLSLVSLAEARALAVEARKQLHAGTDPLAHRQAERQQAAIAAAKSITFNAATAAYLEAHRDEWRNARHAKQWASSLEAYAAPVIGNLPVQAIDTSLVLRVLQPIWATRTETASRLRGRIESVLSWSTVHGYRTGDNPARWKDHLDHLLPSRSKVREVQHLAALPFSELPAFMLELRQVDTIPARALEFLILTATRTGDLVGQASDDKPPMRWSHVDLTARTWTIRKTKTGKTHVVPLSDAAMAVLQHLLPLRQKPDDVVFPGTRSGAAINPGTMLKTLRAMGRASITAHGFRATFRTWAGDRTTFPKDVIEAALTHVIADDVEAAYRRGSFFDKRRRLMDAWSRYASSAPASATVVPLRG
jgi:integrase